MSLTKRLLTFGIGFFMGVLLLIFFWNKKDVSFNYGPDARVISQILKKKKQIFERDVEDFLQVRDIDSSRFREIIKKADIDFSKSKQHQKPCREFFLESEYEHQSIEFQVQLCDSLARYYRINKKL
jgi:hypothetical protein